MYIIFAASSFYYYNTWMRKKKQWFEFAIQNGVHDILAKYSLWDTYVWQCIKLRISSVAFFVTKKLSGCSTNNSWKWQIDSPCSSETGLVIGLYNYTWQTTPTQTCVCSWCSIIQEYIIGPAFVCGIFVSVENSFRLDTFVQDYRENNMLTTRNRVNTSTINYGDFCLQ